MTTPQVVVGIDPSLTACGVSDGVRHEILARKAAA
jgi:hypothetical protein